MVVSFAAFHFISQILILSAMDFLTTSVVVVFPRPKVFCLLVTQKENVITASVGLFT